MSEPSKVLISKKPYFSLVGRNTAFCSLIIPMIVVNQIYEGVESVIDFLFVANISLLWLCCMLQLLKSYQKRSKIFLTREALLCERGRRYEMYPLASLNDFIVLPSEILLTFNQKYLNFQKSDFDQDNWELLAARLREISPIPAVQG